jgi:DNA/RNA-binding protein KIN17
MKKERLNKSDEQRERQMIFEQIERAAAMEQQARGGEDEAAGPSGSNAESSASTTPPPVELKRAEGEKVKLSFSLKEGEKVKLSFSLKKPANNSPPAAPVASTSTAEQPSTPPAASEATSPPATTKTDSTPAAQSALAAPAPVNVFKTNVFKMGASKPAAPSANVFKMGGGSSTKPSLGAMSGTKRPLSVTEALMQEDMERKRRRMDREGVRG